MAVKKKKAKLKKSDKMEKAKDGSLKHSYKDRLSRAGSSPEFAEGAAAHFRTDKKVENILREHFKEDPTSKEIKAMKSAAAKKASKSMKSDGRANSRFKKFKK